MSVRWIGHVWETSPYEGRRLLLHLALADFANDEGTCFPSQKTLALKARTTEAWVSVSVKQMIRDGLLEILERGGGRGNRTIYKLHKGVTEKGETEKGETQSQQTPNDDDVPTIYRNRNEPSISLTSQFEQFWNKYPRKVAKVAARNVFISLMKRSDAPSLDILLKAVDTYNASAIDKKFIAHPATWLRQGRWEDDLEHSPTTPIKDWQLDQALQRIAPAATLNASWEECLQIISHFEERVIEPCREMYDRIRAKQ